MFCCSLNHNYGLNESLKPLGEAVARSSSSEPLLDLYCSPPEDDRLCSSLEEGVDLLLVLFQVLFGNRDAVLSFISLGQANLALQFSLLVEAIHLEAKIDKLALPLVVPGSPAASYNFIIGQISLGF